MRVVALWSFGTNPRNTKGTNVMSTILGRHRSATRFFWGWLGASTATSIAGNVAHAVLNTTGSPIIAALASVVPPAVLLAATHGLAVMVRTQIAGKLFRYALALLVALAVCAFVLSFNALFGLAIHQGGMPREIAWLWPLAIDLSVALSTLALLTLTTGKRARREAAAGSSAPRKRATKRPARPKAVPSLVSA